MSWPTAGPARYLATTDRLRDDAEVVALVATGPWLNEKPADFEEFFGLLHLDRRSPNDNTPSCVMEFVEGIDLERHSRTHRRCSQLQSWSRSKNKRLILDPIGDREDVRPSVDPNRKATDTFLGQQLPAPVL